MTRPARPSLKAFAFCCTLLTVAGIAGFIASCQSTIARTALLNEMTYVTAQIEHATRVKARECGRPGPKCRWAQHTTLAYSAAADAISAQLAALDR